MHLLMHLLTHLRTNIACIAWGSLLWKPQGLKLASGWHPGGPPLPLEFAHQSDDSPELALVLCDSARLAPTYWVYLATHDLDEVRAMLGQREKITPARPDIPGRETVEETHIERRHCNWKARNEEPVAENPGTMAATPHR